MDRKDIASQPAIPLLFGRSNILADEIAYMQSIIDFAIGQHVLTFELNEKSFIRLVHMSDAKGRSTVLEVDWNPIVDQDQHVQKIIVILRDVTEIQGLREAAHQQKVTLDILSQIIDASVKTFRRFSQEMQSYLAANLDLLSKSPVDIAAINRNFHTIKGNARVFSFRAIADCIHEVEQQIRMAASLSEPELKAVISAGVERSVALLDAYNKVEATHLHHGQSMGEDLAEFMNSVRQSLQQWSEGADSSAVCREIQSAFKRLGTETLSDGLQDLLCSIPGLARDLAKPAPFFIIDDGSYRIKAEAARTMVDIIGHAIRNSLDHGIEEPAIRKQKGKTPEGRIFIGLSLMVEHVLLRIQDDGQGLDLEAIQKKAESLGIYFAKQDVQGLANLIFNQELSTARQVNQISGRGIGMDAMRGLAQQVGATVAIELQEWTRPQAVNFELTFRFPRSILVEEGPSLAVKAG